MRVAIGIDVGGTKIAGALVTEAGVTSHEETIRTPRSEQGADPDASATAALVQRLERSARDAHLQTVAIGIGVPEYVSRLGDVSSSEVLAWEPSPLRDVIGETTVVFDSDVRCATHAEQQLGQGRDHTSFLFVSVGTGISHTLVINDQIWPGHRGEALALGELTVDIADAIRTGAPLTVERQASGRAIELELANRKATGAGAGNIESRAGRIVARAIATVVHVTDPAAIILGGGLGSSAGPFADALAHRFDELLSARPAPPPLLQSKLGPEAGVIGAGLIAHRTVALADRTVFDEGV